MYDNPLWNPLYGTDLMIFMFPDVETLNIIKHITLLLIDYTWVDTHFHTRIPQFVDVQL